MMPTTSAPEFHEEQSAVQNRKAIQASQQAGKVGDPSRRRRVCTECFGARTPSHRLWAAAPGATSALYNTGGRANQSELERSTLPALP